MLLAGFLSMVKDPEQHAGFLEKGKSQEFDFAKFAFCEEIKPIFGLQNEGIESAGLFGSSGKAELY